jgi:hypothetical protein
MNYCRIFERKEGNKKVRSNGEITLVARSNGDELEDSNF